MEENKNILYHGSNVIVERPEVRTFGHYKDFGYGFYCTQFEQQAKKWALTKLPKHIVTLYEYTEQTNLQVLRFPEISEYQIEKGTTDVLNTDHSLTPVPPTAIQMGKVYARLILATRSSNEDFADGIFRVYHSPICQQLDNYNSSAYYEPSYVIARAYNQGNFN